MDMDELAKGLLGESKAPPKASEAPADEDAQILYDEWKSAPDSKAGLAALRQLVRVLK